MIQAIEIIARKISWLPGMGWLDTYVNSLHSKKGAFDQTTGDLLVRKDQFKNLVTNPLDNSNPADSEAGSAAGTSAAGTGDEAAGGENGAAKKTEGAKPAPASGQTAQAKPSTSPAAATSTGVPPAYRAQRAATRASCLMFVFLLVMVATVWAIFFFDPRNVPWRHAMSWWRIAAQVTLVFLIPICLHRMVRLWLESDQVKYPDIRYAWDHGMDALQSIGVNINSVPMFLLIGSEDDRHEMAIMGASRLEFRASAMPPGPASLHWYVTPSAVYLFATDVGWISSIASKANQPIDTQAAALASSVPSDAITFGQSSQADAPVEGTIMASQWQPPSDSVTSVIPNTGNSVDSQGKLAQGTLMVGDEAALMTRSTPSHEATLPASPSLKLSSGESSAAIDRLRHVTHLIRNVRGSLCPVNGVLVLLPSRMIDASAEDIGEYEKAIQSDLRVVNQEMQIRCPVSVLVTGMEKQAGFRELIRRVGIDRAVWQRFGKKFEPETENGPEELRSFTAHVVGAFEDWIYTLFRERESLSKPGNTNLYELLCNVRCSMKSRLERILVNTFSNQQSSLLFSGCYFAATGSTPDQQGFVRGVMDKLADEQELLEWTRQAKAEDRRVRWLSRLGWLTCLLGVAALVFSVGHRWLLWW